MGQDLDHEVQITRWGTTYASLALAGQPNALSRPDSLRNVYHIRPGLFCCRAAEGDLTLTTVCRLFESQRQACFLISSRHRPSRRLPPGAASPRGGATSRRRTKELFKKATESTGARENKIVR